MIVAMVLLAVTAITVAVVIYSLQKRASAALDQFNRTYGDYDVSADIDLDSLNKSVENLKNLQLDTSVNTASSSSESSDGPTADFVKYSYTDVTTVGNDITVVPNGGLDGSTVLYGDKDLNGFLDYVDAKVLEEGRSINREFFYDMLSCMLVDKDLSSDTESIEKNMVMSLAVTNNFFGTDVNINNCELDAGNAAEYRYNVTVLGKNDTWIINYGKHEMFMNNGATEYTSDMFKDEYLATWLVAIEEYYGIKQDTP